MKKFKFLIVFLLLLSFAFIGCKTDKPDDNNDDNVNQDDNNQNNNQEDDNNQEEEDLIPASMNIEFDDYEIFVGDNEEINIEIDGNPLPVVGYISENENIATFENGVLTGVSEGETTISVYDVADSSKVLDTATVYVQLYRSLKATVDYNEIMDKKTEQKIIVTLAEDSQDAIVSYSCEDSAVTVDQEGNITAVEAGNAVVKVIITNPKDDQLTNEYKLNITVEETEFPIIYDLGDVVIDVELPQIYEKGKGVALPVIEATTHLFMGWTINGEEATEISADSLGPVSVVAQWRLIETGPFNVQYDLNGGLFEGGYKTCVEVGTEFLADFNAAAGTKLTFSNFFSSSSSSIKKALANSDLLTKWNWLFKYMYEDLKQYNEANGTAGDSYCSDTLRLLPEIIAGNTETISATDGGPNLRTLVRSYLSSIMNESKGSEANLVFAAYTPDFSLEATQQALIKNQFALEAVLGEDELLPTPIKEHNTFVGWMNKYGEVVTKPNYHGLYTAVWAELNPVTSIEITNKVTEINMFETHQLQWEILPADAPNKEVKFKSSDENIASVDKNGLITAHNIGTVTITILSLSTSNEVDEMTVEVITPGYFDISYETNSYVQVGYGIQLNAIYYDKKHTAQEIVWSSLTEDIATVDADGFVTGVKVGMATIRATLKDNSEIYQDFVVTVLDAELNEALNFVLNAHESNVYVEYGLPIGAGTPAYYADIIGSVSKLLFNDELTFNTKYNAASNEKYGDELKDRVMESIEFITVHYTGNMNTGSNAAANASWFALPRSENNTSIHYTTGNDGVYKCLDEQYRAAHAGDDGSAEQVEKFGWRDTNLEVLDSDPLFPVVTITSNATFAINGRDTGIKVPEETKFGRGFVTDSKWLNDMGIAVNIDNGKYQLGTCWWCYTQVWEGRICSNGGNKNSIGIESCVDAGSDLWYTWQKTAQLVADIMYRHNLDITKVKGHHFFSAKDCPQPMLENELRLWWEFIELVQSEYERRSEFENYTIKFSSTSDLVNSKGRVTKQANTSQIVTYKVEISDGTTTQTVELASIVAGKYCK